MLNGQGTQRLSTTIHALRLGTITLDASFLLEGRSPGTLRTIDTRAFVISAPGLNPILVDTGFRSPAVIERLGMNAEITDDCALDAQLARLGLTRQDIGMVVLTHLHVDHAGHVHDFDTSTPVLVNRRELDFAVGGVQGLFYAPEDIHHVLERVYTPGAVRFLDFTTDVPIEIAPGVFCERAGGHTPGMMFVRVSTDDGIATICSDVVYDAVDQLAGQGRAAPGGEPLVSNNFVGSIAEERAAIKRALHNTTFLLPSHSCGVRLSEGRVVDVLDDWSNNWRASKRSGVSIPSVNQS